MSIPGFYSKYVKKRLSRQFESLVHGTWTLILPVRVYSVLLLLFFIFLLPVKSEAQFSSYGQLWNEVQFSHPINDKWSAEINLGGTFSNTPSDPGFLHTNIQRTARGWAHYYFSPRWKFSSFIAYYYNKDVPDIGQFNSNEFRTALQGTYYFHKIGYTLSTRMRGELRHLENIDGNYENIFRYRQQIKFLKPINSQSLRAGVFYMLVSDEIFIKSQAKTTGLNFLDRNRVSVGAGYLITDDFQIELAYANEVLPRDNGNQLVNAVALTISFNNFLPNIKKRISSKPDDTDPGE